MPEPTRGEVFDARLDPVEGHEQGGGRPVLILSIEPMNRSAAELVIGAPITTTDWSNALHRRIEPPEGGVDRVSFAMPEMVRSMSVKRLGRRYGRVDAATVDDVARRVGILAGLGRSR